MNCSHCFEDSPIVWTDFCSRIENYPSIFIKLCWKCLCFLNYKKEQQDILSSLLICCDCNKKFISKKETQIRCSVCWSKILNKNLNKKGVKNGRTEQSTLY